MADGLRRLERAGGCGGSDRDGGAGLDWVAGLQPVQKSRPGAGTEARELAEGSARRPLEWISTVALGVGANSPATPAMAPAVGCVSLSEGARDGGGQSEIFCLRRGGPIVGISGLAIGGRPFGVSESVAGMEPGATGALFRPAGQQRSFSGVAVGESALSGVTDPE